MFVSSTLTRATRKTCSARSSIGRTPAFQAGGMSSTLIRVALKNLGRRALVSQAGCKPAVFGLWRFDSVPTHLKITPHSRSGGIGRHAMLKPSCPTGIGVRISSSRLHYTDYCGLAGAKPTFIRSVARFDPGACNFRLQRCHPQRSEAAQPSTQTGKAASSRAW